MKNFFCSRLNFFYRITLIYILCLLFLPKISLIELLNYRQGIRFENIFGLFYCVILLFTQQKEIKIKFNLLWCIFFYLILVNIYSTILAFDVEWIINLRVLEYIIICYAIYYSITNGLIGPTVFSSYIYINFILSLLQYFRIIGGFASFGFLEAGHGWLQRPYGLTGGPWELSATVILAYLCYAKLTQIKINTLATLCAAFCVFIAGTRANIIAFVMIFIYLNYNKLSIKLVLYLLVTTFCFFLSIETYFPDALMRAYQIFNISLIDLFNAGINIPKIIEILGIDPSLKERFRVWTNAYLLWTSNPISFFFGIGWHNLYMESFIFRILFSFGIIGVLTFLYYCLSLDFVTILFLLVCGLTLDLFVSAKIFCFFAFYLIISKNHSRKSASP